MAGKMVDYALDYVSRGWAVFPCAEREKVPAIQGGFKAATCDREQIELFWNHRPNANIGIATGGVSGGLIVLDFDSKADGTDGMDYLHDWEREHGELPETVTATTGGGGYHMLYIADTPIGCSVCADYGVDVRGDGGYIVAPPSVHPSGGVYAWENGPDDHPIAKADANVLAFVASVQSTGARGPERKPRFELPREIGKGMRNDTLMRYAASMQSRGDDDLLILSALEAANKLKCKPPLPEGELVKIVESVCSRYDKGVAKAEVIDRPNLGLSIDGSGRVRQTIGNFSKALSNDPSLAGRWYYDTAAYTKMVELPLPWDGGTGQRAVSDADYSALAEYLERYGLTKRQALIDAVTNYCHANKRNLVTEWLDSLVWDGEERVPMIATVLLGAEPNDLNTETMRVLFDGAVARAYRPGTKFDIMPVLYGPQGIGKSYFVFKLARRRAWYCDNLNTIDGDAATEKLRGLWFAEMAELLATKRQKDVEAIKAFLTSTDDVIRPKYARETEHRPRCCVFVGTTNNAHFLTDKSGNRRFPVVECAVHEPVVDLFSDEADDYIEQCWAEAVARYKAGEGTLELSPHAKALMADNQQLHIEDDPRVGMIQDYLDGLIEEGRADLRVCVAELCENALKMRPEDYMNKRSVSNEVHSIMRHQIEGWRLLERKQKLRNFGAQICYLPLGEPEDGWKSAGYSGSNVAGNRLATASGTD